MEADVFFCSCCCCWCCCWCCYWCCCCRCWCWCCWLGVKEVEWGGQNVGEEGVGRGRQTGHLGSLGRPQSGSHPSSSWRAPLLLLPVYNPDCCCLFQTVVVYSKLELLLFCISFQVVVIVVQCACPLFSWFFSPQLLFFLVFSNQHQNDQHQDHHHDMMMKEGAPNQAANKWRAGLSEYVAQALPPLHIIIIINIIIISPFHFLSKDMMWSKVCIAKGQ